MLQLIGLVLLVGAGWFMFRMVKAPVVNSRTAVRHLPIYATCFFISSLGGVGLLLGPRFTTVTVSVVGPSSVMPSYLALSNALGKEFKFNSLDNYARRSENAEAVSCSPENLDTFVRRSADEAGVVLQKRLLVECPHGSKLTNFLHPHISVYLQ